MACALVKGSFAAYAPLTRVLCHGPLGLRRWLQEEISISFDLQKGFESPQTGMYKPFFELDIGPLITVVEMSALKWDDKKGSTEA